jgi:hypothetical protein
LPLQTPPPPPPPPPPPLPPQVDVGAGGASVAAIDGHLNGLRPAINAMGGAVEVVSFEAGVATLRYKGPPPLAKGLTAAVKDQFKDVSKVVIVGFD